MWKGTHPESSETGPRIHSPPRLKYLKHPVRRMARYLSVRTAGKIQESESRGIVVASGCREVGHAVRTLRTKEVVQRDTQDVDGRRKQLARPVPPVENLRERVPVGKVELSGNHRCEEHDI